MFYVREGEGGGGVGKLGNFQKSVSETSLLKKFHDKSRVNDKIFRSKSLDFFRDSLTESRCRGRRRFDRLRDRNSVRSDVCDWMAKIRGIVLSEDDEVEI